MFNKEICFKEGENIYLANVNHFLNKIQPGIYKTYVKFIIDEVQEAFKQEKNRWSITLKDNKVVSRTVHNVQVLEELFNYSELFIDDSLANFTSAEKIFDVVLLALLHNLPVEKKCQIMESFKKEYSNYLGGDIKTKIDNFEKLYVDYRRISQDYTGILQNNKLDEVDKAKLFYAALQDKRRVAYLKLIDQVATANNLSHDDPNKSAAVFYSLMNASCMFGFSYKPDTNKHFILEKNIPKILQDAYAENNRDRYQSVISRIEHEFKVDYFELYPLVFDYINNKLLVSLRNMQKEGELAKLGISSNISIHFRRKELARIEEKLKKQRHFYDLVGLKIRFDDDLSEAQSYKMAFQLNALLSSYFFKKPLRNPKDYFTDPKKNGYKNVIHASYEEQIPGKVPVEIQIVSKKDDIANQYGKETNHFIYSGKLSDPEIKEKIVYIETGNSGLAIGTKKHNKDNGIVDLGVNGDLFDALYDLLKKNDIDIYHMDSHYYFEIKNNGKYERLNFDNYRDFPNGSILRVRKKLFSPVNGILNELKMKDVERKRKTQAVFAPSREKIKIQIHNNRKLINEDFVLPESCSLCDLLYDYYLDKKLPNNFLVTVTNGKSVHNIRKNTEEIIDKYSKIEIVKIEANLLKRLRSEDIWTVKDIKKYFKKEESVDG